MQGGFEVGERGFNVQRSPMSLWLPRRKKPGKSNPEGQPRSFLAYF